MKLRAFASQAIIIAALAASVSATPADRMTDRDVKELVERIDEARDRFEDALDGKIKHDIIRGPSGEVKVDNFLDDFQKNVERLRDRLKPDYAASTEAATVLRQGSDIERFLHGQPPGSKGESEWNRLASDLKTLADAYGADFPLTEHASVRRIGDGEVAAAAEGVAHAAGDFKKSLDADLKKDPSLDKVSRETVVREADELEKSAKSLRERVKDGKP